MTCSVTGVSGRVVAAAFNADRWLVLNFGSFEILDTSNTLHRHACLSSDGKTYCGHFYALYFLKGQVTGLGGGHRHGWESAAVWTANGVVTHGGYSAHGDPDPVRPLLAPECTP